MSYFSGSMPISQKLYSYACAEKASDSIWTGLSLTRHHDLPNVNRLGSTQIKKFIKAISSKGVFLFANNLQTNEASDINRMSWCSSRQGMMKHKHDELERSDQDLTKCQGHMLTQLDHAPYQSMRRTMGPEPELARHSRFRWPQPIWVKHTLHGSELFRDHESVAVFFFIMHGVRATWAATRSFVTCIEDDHSSRETYQPIQNKKDA